MSNCLSKPQHSGLGCKSSTNSLACSWHIRRSCHADKAKLYWHHSKLRHTCNHSAVGSKQSKVHHWPSFPHIFQFAFHMHKEPERKLMSHEVSLLTNLNSLHPQIASESFTPGSNVYALACHDSPQWRWNDEHLPLISSSAIPRWIRMWQTWAHGPQSLDDRSPQQDVKWSKWKFRIQRYLESHQTFKHRTTHWVLYRTNYHLIHHDTSMLIEATMPTVLETYSETHKHPMPIFL